MNLTDEQIIKAWECCCPPSCNCKECPMQGVNGCWVELKYETLNLIKRLQAENEGLQTTKKLNKKQITELKQHILKLQHILISFMNEVENWEHKHNIDTSKIPQIAVLGTEKGNIIKQIKSEARKELAERLRDELGEELIYEQYPFVGCAIDNILEEMEQEENVH